MLLMDVSQYEFVYRRASFQVYKKYNINKLELSTLLAFSWFLRHRNRQIIGELETLEQLTGNSREQWKLRAPFEGLLKKGFIGSYEYISSPNSKSYGLSDLGVNTLIEFDKVLTDFQEKFKESPYRIGSGHPPSVIEDELTTYKVRTKTA
jgi:hypothetical protein